MTYLVGIEHSSIMKTRMNSSRNSHWFTKGRIVLHYWLELYFYNLTCLPIEDQGQLFLFCQRAQNDNKCQQPSHIPSRCVKVL